jgi:hypothetical protein
MEKWITLQWLWHCALVLLGNVWLCGSCQPNQRAKNWLALLGAKKQGSYDSGGARHLNISTDLGVVQANTTAKV